MNNSLKTLLALLAELILIFAAGCNSDSDYSGSGGDSNGDYSSESSHQDATDPIGIGYSIGADGTWAVYTAAGLQAWASEAASDLDTSCTLYACIEWDSSNDWTPVRGSAITDSYNGTFDGGGHTISGLKITWSGSSSSDNYAGFFMTIGENGMVQNLTLEDVVVAAGGGWAGGIAAVNRGTISGCYLSGVFSGDADCTGGIAGSNSGTITASYSTAYVTGADYVGGIAGANASGTIIGCYSPSGIIEGADYVGGIAGSNTSGTITACYSMASISGTEYVGGIAGRNFGGTVTGCYYYLGSVSGNSTSSAVGAISGYNRRRASISACYWNASNIASGIGNDEGTSQNVAQVTDDDWTEAMSEMNTAISASGWQYEEATAGSAPLALKKS